MSFPDQETFKGHSDDTTASGSAEATLRLIATLPAPAGLEDRVHAGLCAAQPGGRVLSWPRGARSTSGWMRSAAAAAIVFVVAGGGWGIYSRVQKPQSATVIVMPHPGAPGGFSNAGAMHTPKTLNGPVVAHPASIQQPIIKVVVPPPNLSARPASAGKVTAQPAR